jgi:uncharacterized protein with ATP-grasp and redox domains
MLFAIPYKGRKNKQETPQERLEQVTEYVNNHARLKRCLEEAAFSFYLEKDTGDIVFKVNMADGKIDGIVADYIYTNGGNPKPMPHPVQRLFVKHLS